MKEITISVEEDVYEVLKPMVELNTIGQILADYAQKQQQNRWLGKIYKVQSPASKPRPVFGSGKGKVWMSDDFDAPLEEMKAYME